MTRVDLPRWGALGALLALAACGRLGFDDLAPGGTGPGSFDASVVPGQARAIAAGSAFSCLADADGAVWCWGDNRMGQLGPGAAEYEPRPRQVPGLADVIALDATTDFACALTGAGEVRCWGQNAYGRLGLLPAGGIEGPRALALPAPAVAISTAPLHACAVLADASLWCWGKNHQGILGIGPPGGGPEATAPTQVLVAVTAVATGDHHTCAVRTSGEVWCWGDDSAAQLGLPSTTTVQDTPQRVPDVTAVGIIGFARATCAVLDDGRTRCWGDGSSGEFGDGTNGPRESPGAPGGLPGLRQIHAGHEHACALDGQGLPHCWGRNDQGQLGDGSFLYRFGPVPIASTAPYIDVAAGTTHACGLRADGSATCWGLGGYGELGDGRTAALAPTRVTLPDAATNLVAGARFTCALAGGRPYCWGDNDGFAVSGATQPAAIPTPTAVPGVTGATQLAAGWRHACALVGDEVTCWGANGWGQLATTPQLDRPDPTPWIAPGDVSRIAAAGEYTCALVGQDLYCAGSNRTGVIAGLPGTEMSTSTPTRVLTAPAAITSIGAGDYHVCVTVTGADAPHCWGENRDGQLGREPLADVAPPGIADAFTGGPLVAVEGGGWVTCGRSQADLPYCWGANWVGQLGDGTYGSSTTPRLIAEVTGALTSITAGRTHACAATTTGTWCWGENRMGSVGASAGTFATTPVAVPLTGVVELAAGNEHTCARTGGGEVYCWGDNAVGQVGQPVLSRSPVPVEVAR